MVQSKAPARGGAALFALLFFFLASNLLQQHQQEQEASFLRQPVQGRSLLSDKTSVANNGHSFLEAMPRNNWEGDSVSSQFCSWNAATNTCNWSDYAQSISIILLAPAILGLFFLFLFPILICTRSLCLRKGVCLIPWFFNSIELWIIRACFFVIIVIMLCMVAMGFVGNSFSHTGIDNAVSNTSAFINALTNATDSALSVAVSIDSSYNGTFTQVQAGLTDAQKTLNSYKGYLNDAETGRYVLFLFTYIAIFGVGVGTIFSTICFRSSTFFSNFCYAIVMWILIFVVLLFCIAMGVITSDICNVYDEIEAGDYDNVFSKFIGDTWGLNCTALAELDMALNKEYNSTTEQLCQKYNQTCQSPDVSNCQECTLLSNKTLVELTLVNETYYCSSMYCPSTNCSQGEVCYSRVLTYAECATECINPQYKNISSQLVNYVKQDQELYATIKSLQPYLGCIIYDTYVTYTDYPVCVDFLAGTYIQIVAGIVLACLWLPFQALNLISFDRASNKEKY